MSLKIKNTPLRYKHMHKALLFFVMIMISVFSGCVSDDDCTMPVPITYSEENAQYVFTMDVLHTETAHAYYYFDQTLDETVPRSCIESTDSIIMNLDAVSVKPQIYIFSDDTFNGVNIIGNSLYTSQDSYQNVDYVTNVVLAVYGDCSHYGLAYGYATILCQKLGWEIPGFSTDSVPEHPEIYDLNLLCFDQNFVSEEDIRATQQTAYLFASYLLETYGEETIRQLLSLSHTGGGMTELCKKLCEYYAAQGIDHTPSSLCFGYGGISYDYVLRSDFGTFYIGTDWTDANVALNPLVTEDFLLSNYKETSTFFEQNLKQMQSYQKLFGLGDYDNELTVIFPNSRSGSQYSYYQSGLHQIIVYNVDSLMHEYIHALTKPSTSQELWETEGFARYFSYYYDDYGIAFLNKDYNSAVQSNATEYLFEFKQTIDRPIDMQIDFKELENIAVYSRNCTDPNASYVAGSSFIQYLVREYGESFVVQYTYGKDELPKPYSELVTEWNQYIEENYSNFSRYHP